MDYQGLTIQFNGDASGLLATLRQIDGVTTETQRSLSQVTKALKLDPTSAALYASQTKLTSRAYEEQGAYLSKLRTSYADYSSKLTVARREEERNARALRGSQQLYKSMNVDQLNEQIASSRQRLVQLSKEYGRSAPHLAEYRKEQQRLTDTVKKLREAARYNSQVRSDKSAYDESVESVKKYEAELDKLEDKIAEAEAAAKALGEQLARVEVDEWLNGTTSGQFFASLGEGGAALSNVGDKLMNVGVRATAAEAALIGLFGRQVLNEAEEYGNAISQVGGYLELNGSALGEMSDLALYWGKETQFSATEAAQAMSELAKGGMTDAQIAGGALEATMQLAAAGGISMADAATVAVNAIKVFDLSAEDATDVADALAGAANKSTAEIGGLASSFRYVSGWAGLADYSINDVAGALGLLADHGLQAEMAGTGLRNFMQRLGAPTGKAKELLEQYGVEVYDTSGKMKGLTELVDELNEAFGDLDDATRNETLNTIFGARGLPAAIALMDAGSAELQEYISATERSGYALEMMQARMGDLGWALEYLRGEFETAQVNLGQAFTPIIINAANALEDMLSAFNSLDTSAQRDIANTLIKIAAIGPSLLAVGAAMKVIGGGMVGISRVAVAIKTLTTGTGTLGLAIARMTGGAISAGGAMAALAGGIAAVVAVIGVASFAKYQYDQYKAQKRTERLDAATRGLVETIDDIKTGDAIGELQLYGDVAQTTARDFETLLDQQAELAETISGRNADAQAQIEDFERAKRIIEEYGDQTGLTAQELGALQWALELVNGEFDANFQYNSELGQIYDDQGTSIQDLILDIDDLIAAREREIKAEAIQENMRDLYQAQSQLAADREKAEKDYLEALEEENRLRNDLKNIETANGEDRSQWTNEELRKWAEASQRLQDAHDNTEQLRQNLADVDDMIAANAESLQGFEEQLAEVMELPNDEALKQWFTWLSNGSDEVSQQIRDLAAKFGDDLPKALNDAGLAAEDFALLTRDEFVEILANSASVDEVADKVARLAEEKRKAAETENPEVKATEEGVDEATESMRQLREEVDLASQKLAEERANLSTPIRGAIELETDTDGNGTLSEALNTMGRIRGLRGLGKHAGTAQVSGTIWEFMEKLLPDWRKTSLGSKTGSANVSGNLHQSTNDLKEWNRLGMDSKWGKATIALAIQSKGIKQRDGGINYYRHADGYITNHSIFTSGHLAGEAGIEAVLPLNNRAATRPLTDTIADGVARRVAGATQYNLYINDARVNDDPAIRSAFIGLMTTLERKGAMNVGNR